MKFQARVGEVEISADLQAFLAHACLPRTFLNLQESFADFIDLSLARIVSALLVTAWAHFGSQIHHSILLS
jgi:hypothetical protein